MPTTLFTLGEDGVALVDHRVRGGALFGEVDDRFGLEFLNHVDEKFVVGDVTDEGLDGVAGEFVPDAEAIGERADGSQSLRAEFVVPLAAHEIIDDGDLMTLLREVERCGPNRSNRLRQELQSSYVLLLGFVTTACALTV